MELRWTQCWGSSCPCLVPFGTNCTIPLLAVFSSHAFCCRVALEIASTRYKWGNGEFWFLHLQMTVSNILVWITFCGLVLLLMTSSTPWVWVHAFWMEVVGIDACSCWGQWQASASAGLAPRGCVTVTPVVTLAQSPWLCLHLVSQPGCALCVGKSSEHPPCSGP